MDYIQAKQLERNSEVTPTMYAPISGNAEILGRLVGELQEAVKQLSGDQNNGQVEEIMKDITTIQEKASELTTRVTATEGVANKAKSDLATLTSRVTTTEGVANKAKTDLASLTTRVTDTESVANKAKEDIVSILARLDALETPPTE